MSRKTRLFICYYIYFQKKERKPTKKKRKRKGEVLACLTSSNIQTTFLVDKSLNLPIEKVTLETILSGN